MSYLVLARKYRPQSFEDVVGQTPVSRTLSNALETGRVAHGYIFSGPRGVGKTTTARILAKCLNCEKGPTITPCNKCDACVSISQGTSTDDVLEIDGASNRESSAPSCSIIRVIVHVEKSGRLKSGHCRSMPCPASRSRKYATFVDIGDDANPCR